MLDTLLSLLAPHVCVVCGEEKGVLCIDCGKKSIVLNKECFVCFKPALHNELCVDCSNQKQLVRLTSVGWYKDNLKNAIYTFKFNGKRGGSSSLARLLYEVYKPLHKDSLVTYIPTTAIHIRERGFDHAKLLGQSFASYSSLPCVALLARKNNHRQLGRNKVDRLQAISGAFIAIHPKLLKDKHIVLIDDVTTTGATLSEAAKVLLQAGARSVEALVIAKTPANH